MRILLPVLLGAVTIAILHMALPSGSTSEQAGTSLLVEYPIPPALGKAPRNIVVESPGRVWFTMPLSNAIGSLVVTSTQDYDFFLHPIPTAGSEPYDLAYDDDAGMIWFTERAGNKIGRLEPLTGSIAEFLITSTMAVTPTGIAVAPNGDVWFTASGTDSIGRYNPGTSSFELRSYPEDPNKSGDPRPEDIAVASDDSIWFTAPGWNEVANFIPSKGTFKRVAVTHPFVPPFPPGDITIDNARLPWVTAPSKDWFGPFLEGTLAIWRWRAVPTPGGGPTGITFSSVGGINYIWFVETSGSRVGHMAFTSQQKVLYTWDQPTPTTGSQPRGIAVDADGHAWIVESGGNRIAEWRPPYFFRIYLPTIRK